MEKAAGALWNLSRNADNDVPIHEAGGIPPLVKLARSGTEGQKGWAARALENLALNDVNKVAIGEAELAMSGTEGQDNAAGALLASQ